MEASKCIQHRGEIWRITESESHANVYSTMFLPSSQALLVPGMWRVTGLYCLTSLTHKAAFTLKVSLKKKGFKIPS